MKRTMTPDTMMVHVPESDTRIRRAIRHYHPRASVREYDGDPTTVARARGDVLVIYCATPPRGGPRNAIGMTEHRSRVVLIFTRFMRDALRLRWADPRLPTAIGRTIAHEVEHLRRGTRGHDRSGWFTACGTPDELLARVAP